MSLSVAVVIEKDARGEFVRKFALQVAENYVASMAPDQRQVPFKMGVPMPDSMDRTQEHVLRMQQEQLDRIERDRANQVAREACAECHEPTSKPHTLQERDDLFRQLQRPDLPPSPQLDWIEAHPA